MSCSVRFSVGLYSREAFRQLRGFSEGSRGVSAKQWYMQGNCSAASCSFKATETLRSIYIYIYTYIHTYIHEASTGEGFRVHGCDGYLTLLDVF